MKEKIRPIYSELQGYLAQAPPPGENGSNTESDSSLWNQLNRTIDDLNEVTEENFDKFKIQPINNSGFIFVKIVTYRQRLGGLIAHLHAKYFSDEPAPFSDMPSTVITQNQSQSVDIHLILDLQSRIDAELPKHKEGSKEKTFLQKMKENLPNLKTGVDILTGALNIGEELNLDPALIRKLLGL